MALPNDAQMVVRRVYADDGSLLREDKAPKDLANDRATLLAWWAESDAAKAQAEADAAAAESERLAALEQQPANGEAMAIPALAAAIDQHATLIEALDQRTATIEAAQPDEILRLATQIQLGAGAAMALEAKALEVQAQIEATATGADQRLGELDQRMAESVAKVADLVTGGRQQLETTTATITADAKKQVAALVTSTVARVADMRGPKGTQGNPGASTVIGAGAPQGAAAMEPLINRGAVIGDCYIDAQDPRRRAYRWDGSTWEPGPEMVSLELRDVRVQALSTGNTVFAGGSGSGGGGSATGSDPLMVRTAAGSSGSSTQIADSSRWSVPLKVKGLPSPTSATVAIQITAADGAQAGKSLFILCGLLYEPGGVSSIRSRYTEFSLLGDLKDNVEVDLTMQIQGAAAPGGLSVSVPAGVNAAAIYLTITRNAVGATRFILAGGVEWLLSQDTSPDASHPSLLPAWQV